MNKQKLNIILVPLVFALWIVIILKIFSFTRLKEYSENHTIAGAEHSEIKDPIDTIRLLLNYSDPFDRNISGMAINNSILRAVPHNFFDHSPEAPLPEIVFAGVIETDNSKNTVGLLMVNGRSVLVSRGDIVEGMQVINCWQDSVTLRFNRKNFTFKR